jgi:hypothetical protein
MKNLGIGSGKFKGVMGGTTAAGTQKTKHGVPLNMPQPLVKGGKPGAANLTGQQKRVGNGYLDAMNRPKPGRGHGG